MRGFIIFSLSFLFFFPLLSEGQLRRGEVTIEFGYSDGTYNAYVQRGGHKTGTEVLLGDGKRIDALAKDPSLYDESLSSQAYDLILGPLEHLLRRGDKIYFSPAGQLHFINLSALTDPQGKRCFERYTMYRVSDVTKRVEDEPENLGYGTFFLYGGMNYKADPEAIYQHCWTLHLPHIQFLMDDCEGWADAGIDFGRSEDGTRAGFANLTSSRKEIKFIFKMRQFSMIAKTGPEASEENFRLDVRSSFPYIMHLSTHSFQTLIPKDGRAAGLSEEQVMYKSCGLLFSGAGYTLEGEQLPHNLNDGLLYGEEIAKLKMNSCALMVVGACNTALGRVSQDGVIGLQSAFKKAGVKTLMLTLWSVNDRATAYFMQQFYLHLLKEGKSKYESFSLARQDMIRSEDFNDPTYWAPFILLD